MIYFVSLGKILKREFLRVSCVGLTSLLSYPAWVFVRHFKALSPRPQRPPQSWVHGRCSVIEWFNDPSKAAFCCEGFPSGAVGPCGRGAAASSLRCREHWFLAALLITTPFYPWLPSRSVQQGCRPSVCPEVREGHRAEL